MPEGHHHAVDDRLEAGADSASPKRPLCTVKNGRADPDLTLEAYPHAAKRALR